MDGEYFINNALAECKKVLAEGAQGSMLDIDFGTYPFVTSSNTITAGVCSGLGVAPHKIGEVIGIMKAYCTRVGSGPFPTELHDVEGEYLRKVGHEFGATTGRPRRCGWIDIPQLKYTIMLNGVTQIAITKIDVLNDMEFISAGTHYEYDGKETDELPFDLTTEKVNPVYHVYQGWKQDTGVESEFECLPEALKAYTMSLESLLKTPITMISTGPERERLVLRNKN